MQKPLAISIGMFLFLFGLAYAKASKPEVDNSRSPASNSSVAKSVTKAE